MVMLLEQYLNVQAMNRMNMSFYATFLPPTLVAGSFSFLAWSLPDGKLPGGDSDAAVPSLFKDLGTTPDFCAGGALDLQTSVSVSARIN
jgi:hypothetical protein